MNTPSKLIAAVILAAGDGKRMKSETPKVMTELRGRPLIDHAVLAVEGSGIAEKPVIVVSPKHTLVQEFLGERARYVVQTEQLGTGHAVATAEPILRGQADHVVVLYGDMPFLKPGSIARLAATHAEAGNTVTLMTVHVSHFEGIYQPLYNFGRIIRDSEGNIIRSVEMKDATPAEAAGTELNPCYYCFETTWLWQHVSALKNTNAQKEYYLTDLVKIAIDEGQKISSIAIDPTEAIGINTREDLELANTI